MSRLRTGFFYCSYVALWSALITLGGAVVGAIIFPLVGTLADVAMSARDMALSGARQLGFLAFIWAVGIAIVMAFQHAHRRRQAQRPAAAPVDPSPAKDG